MSTLRNLAELMRLTGVSQVCASDALATFHDDKLTALAAIVQANLVLVLDAFARDEVNHLLTNAYESVNVVLAEIPTITVSEEPSVWEALAKHNWDIKRAIQHLSDNDSSDDEEGVETLPLEKLDTPTHFTGPLIEMPHFWETEVDARCTLMNKSYGFMERNKESLSSILRPRMLQWVGTAEPNDQAMPIQYYNIVNRDEHNTRVIIKDVVRTFFDQRTRMRFENFIFAMFHELSGSSYGQELSFVSAVCLLVLNEQETAAVLRYTAKEMQWAVPRSFNTNAWLIESIFEKRFPKIAKHFLNLNFWPDTYMQKILNSLCIHVLPFRLMFNFLDSFFKEGFVFLVKFELAIVEYFESQLLSITDPNNISLLFDIMRLDLVAVTPEDQERILIKAQKMTSDHEDFQNFPEKRKEVFAKKVLPRVEKLPTTPYFEPCEICEKRKPVLLCAHCGPICHRCHRNRRGDHSQLHEVEDW